MAPDAGDQVSQRDIKWKAFELTGEAVFNAKAAGMVRGMATASNLPPAKVIANAVRAQDAGIKMYPRWLSWHKWEWP
jgi:hypothetical protein